MFKILHVLYRSTAELEIYQSLILMYISKRESYKPLAYRVTSRNRLAALDYNIHIDSLAKQKWRN